jgi:Dam-replacing family.
MNLSLNKCIADGYTSQTQKIRVLTEDWIGKNAYCPNCGSSDMKKYANNKPVADFFCSYCKEDYELKGKKKSLGAKINDGAYKTMIERLQADNNPNLLLLTYDALYIKILDYIVIPKQFFVK